MRLAATGLAKRPLKGIGASNCNVMAAAARPNMVAAAAASSAAAASQQQQRGADAFAAVPALAGAKYADELAAACEAVRLASKLCRTVQQQLSAAEKADKRDDSPVTVADYGAQAVVAWALSRAAAGDGDGAPPPRLSMVAEEDAAALRGAEGAPMLARITELVNAVVAGEAGGAPLTGDDVVALIELGDSQGGPAGRHWVLDPIDGTRGFVGMRQYSVCLGMLQDGDVALGVLGCPNLPLGEFGDDDGGAAAAARSGDADRGCLFLAHRGAGAYLAPLWDPAAPPRRVAVSEPAGGPAGARFMESFESRHSDHSFTAAVAAALGVTAAPLRMDSQVKYGLLARGGGGASIFMRFPPPSYREKIWDHAAGFVIVEEAGGAVTDAGGARLDFSRGRWLDLDRGIVAAPPGVHKALLAAVGAAEKQQQK